jgi:hypothetical protein
MSEEGYFDPSKIFIRKIEKRLAENMIVKYHYTHKWSLCKVAYGIFYKTDKINSFFNTTEDKLIGCMVFGQPVGRSAAESISKLIKITEVFELTRLFCFDGYGKNIESYSLSQALKLLQRDFPKLKALITYADGEQGHKGTIYQACGFHYQGNSDIALMPNFSISVIGPPYKWIHSRTAFSTYGSHNVEYLKRKIGHTFWRKKEAKKHRYICLLGNKLQKKKILANLKHRFLPYPKGTEYVEQIEEIRVDSVLENQFFEV